MITLGIESSCDETSVALLRDGAVIQNKIFSQLEHTRFGGVVPEIASRAHLEKIGTLTEAAFKGASLTIEDVDLISVTDSPGLAGALLIGVSFALGLHVRWKTPLTGINHLEGHICSIFLEYPDLELPFLALVVSGGHTAIYRVDGIGAYTCLGQTVDDAAGEAFDKVGKMLGFAYPAGRSIEQEARLATGPEVITFPIARLSGAGLDFSFSGLKTSVKYFISEKGPEYAHNERPAVCRAFQNAVIFSLVNNCAAAMQSSGIKRLALVGGVACNGKLRETLRERLGNQVFYPAPVLCADNGAMIACAGYKRALAGKTRPAHMNPGGTI